MTVGHCGEGLTSISYVCVLVRETLPRPSRYTHVFSNNCALVLRAHRTSEETNCTSLPINQEHHIGKNVGLFEVRKIADDFFLFLEECKDPKACTILLRGGSKGKAVVISSATIQFSLVSSMRIDLFPLVR